MEFFRGTQTPMLESVLFKADQAAAFVPWEEAGPTQGGSVLQAVKAAFQGVLSRLLKNPLKTILNKVTNNTFNYSDR